MGDSLKLTVVGEPVPKGRPRMNRQQGTVYTPKLTRSYELMISTLAMAQKTRFGSNPVRVDLWIHTAKTSCDGDNILKSVLDSLQLAQVFENDRQVIEMHVYTIHSKSPRIELEVTTTEERVETTTGATL